MLRSKDPQFWRPSFSAVSRPMFASKCVLCRIFWDLQILHTSASLKTQNILNKYSNILAKVEDISQLSCQMKFVDVLTAFDENTFEFHESPRFFLESIRTCFKLLKFVNNYFPEFDTPEKMRASFLGGALHSNLKIWTYLRSPNVGCFSWIALRCAAISVASFLRTRMNNIE